MSNISSTLTELSPKQRAVLEMRLKKRRAAASQPRIVARKRDGNAVPMSFAQQRLWFIDQLQPGSVVYNIPLTVRFRGRLDMPALEKTLTEIVRRHESLRTTFAEVDGDPVQVIAPPSPQSIAVIDLGALSHDRLQETARREIQEEASRPFDLAKGPLIRASLLRLSDQEHVILFTMHHIISDGWSIGVLVREVQALYESFVANKPSPLAELPIQYADYALWQKEWMRGERLEGQLSYWKRRLADAPPALELPFDRPRPAEQTFAGAIYGFNLSNALTDALKDLCRQEGATIFMALLAAFQTMLFHYTEQDNIAVSTGIANRNRPEIENLIGFFVNTLILNVDFSDNPTFRELLKQAREVTLDAYAHQDLPFELVVESLHPDRQLSHTPLFQVMFVLQNTPKSDLKLPELGWRFMGPEHFTAKFDLTLFMTDRPGGLSGALEYNTDLFNQSTVARMAAYFQALLEAITREPDERVGNISVSISEGG